MTIFSLDSRYLASIGGGHIIIAIGLNAVLPTLPVCLKRENTETISMSLTGLTIHAFKVLSRLQRHRMRYTVMYFYT